MKRSGIQSTATLCHVCALSLIASIAFNAYAAQDIPTFFDLEKDGDGVISRDEAVDWSALISAWSSIDSNGDGQLDMREWNAIDQKNLSDLNR